MVAFCTIYLVRHGRTEYNDKKLVTGWVDIPLTDYGKQQAEKLREELKHIHIDAVFASDLIRAHQTAEILAQERKLAVGTSKLIRERHFGKFESSSVEAVSQLYNSYRELSDTEVNAHKPDETYESNDELMGRAITFLREVAVAYAGKTVLVVTHSAFLRILLIHLVYSTHKNAPLRFIHNAGFVKLQSDGVEFKILEVNPGGVIK